MRIQGILLEDEGDVAIGRGIAGHIASADADQTAVGRLQSGDKTLALKEAAA